LSGKGQPTPAPPGARAGTLSSRRLADMATDLSAHVSAAEAARLCGLSEKTVRRWIKAGKLRADRQAGAYSVDLAEVSALAGQVPAHGADTSSPTSADMGTDRGADTVEEDARLPEEPGTDILRAEAMATYTRSILEPLVSALERSETRVAELERENGHLTAENATLRASQAARDAQEQASMPPATSEAPAPLWTRGWARTALLVLVIVVAGMVWLVPR
jgi:excisionase family DNA binding protein